MNKTPPTKEYSRIHINTDHRWNQMLGKFTNKLKQYSCYAQDSGAQEMALRKGSEEQTYKMNPNTLATGFILNEKCVRTSLELE